jgi:hypothetical protein
LPYTALECNIENSDLKKMEVKGWKERMRDREQWRLVVEEARTHPGLSCRVVGIENSVKHGPN